MLDLINSWILKNLLDALSEVCNQFIVVFGNLINNIFGSVTDFNNTNMKNIDTFTLVFSITFIVFLMIKQYLTVYVFETSGDPEADPLDIYVRGAVAVAVASCSGIIFDFFLEFSSAFVEDLQSVKISGSQPTGVTDTLRDLASVPINLGTVPIVVVIIGIAMIIALVVFFIVAGIRGAELLLMKMLFPLFACDLVTTNRERFNAFLTSFVITWLAYGLQLISFRMYSMTLLLYTTCDLSEFPVIFAVNIGWMVLMFKAPKWLEKFCYTSGISSSMGGALRTLPLLLRSKG